MTAVNTVANALPSHILRANGFLVPPYSDAGAIRWRWRRVSHRTMEFNLVVPKAVCARPYYVTAVDTFFWETCLDRGPPHVVQLLHHAPHFKPHYARVEEIIEALEAQPEAAPHAPQHVF